MVLPQQLLQLLLPAIYCCPASRMQLQVRSLERDREADARMPLAAQANAVDHAALVVAVAARRRPFRQPCRMQRWQRLPCITAVRWRTPYTSSTLPATVALCMRTSTANRCTTERAVICRIMRTPTIRTT